MVQMDSFGVRSSGSAAAQGGQDTSTEHTNAGHSSPDGTAHGRPGIAGRVLSEYNHLSSMSERDACAYDMMNGSLCAMALAIYAFA